MASSTDEQRRIRKEFNRIGARYARTVARPREPLDGDLSWLPVSRDSKILDVACGPGTYSIPLSRRAAWVVGLDLAESMLRCGARWSRRRHSKLALLQGDATRLPFRSGAFDLCLSAFSFAHFPRPRQVVKEMVRVLRPQGTLAIVDVVAPQDRRQRRALNRLETTREDCYTRIRDAREFAKIFSGLGLRRRTPQSHLRPVSFRRWIAASHLRPGTAAFRRAQRCFYKMAGQQRARGQAASPGARQRYCYIVCQFLLQKAS